jgi:hypothetical protein
MLPNTTTQATGKLESQKKNAEPEQQQQFNHKSLPL